MPKSPRREKRPADAIGLAVMIGKIATGEIEDDDVIAKIDELATAPKECGLYLVRS